MSITNYENWCREQTKLMNARHEVENGIRAMSLTDILAMHKRITELEGRIKDFEVENEK